MTRFEQWKTEMGFAYDLASDATHEGRPLIISYALGMAPGLGDSPKLPHLELSEEGIIDVSFTKSAAELNYTIEYSNDLVSWRSDGTQDVSNFEMAETIIRLPVAGSSSIYVRLRIVEP